MIYNQFFVEIDDFLTDNIDLDYLYKILSTSTVNMHKEISTLGHLNKLNMKNLESNLSQKYPTDYEMIESYNNFDDPTCNSTLEKGPFMKSFYKTIKQLIYEINVYNMYETRDLIEKSTDEVEKGKLRLRLSDLQSNSERLELKQGK
jgi:hypothetical protein